MRCFKGFLWALAGYLLCVGPAFAKEACDMDALRHEEALQTDKRENDLSLVVGGSIYAPDLDGHTVAPIGALYYRHRFDDLHLRGVFSIFENEFDIAQTRNHLQLLGHLDNRTYPFTNTEVVQGREVNGTEIKWGTVNGRVGAGYRLPVSPFQFDNDLRVQLYYQVGYLYSKRVSDTGPLVTLPPDTVVHGPILRLRYDDLQRNSMELIDRGLALGGDAQYLIRGNWSDANYGDGRFTKGDTRDFVKLSAYLVAAAGLPYLSDKNRLVFSVHAGYVPYNFLDRFSAFRIGGLPITSDTDDLDRLHFPGAMFNQFAVYDYAIGSLEYRREISSSLYLFLRGTFNRTSRELFVPSGHGHFRTENGGGGSAGLDSGFFYNSRMHVEYTYDTKMVQNGTSGSEIILLWSKSF